MNELRSEYPSKTTGYIKTFLSFLNKKHILRCFHFNTHNSTQRSPPCAPKTGPHLQWITKILLGCQRTNGINPTSATRQQQKIWHNQHGHITLDLCTVLDRTFLTATVLMYCLSSDPSGNCSLRPGRTVTFWERQEGPWSTHRADCYCPSLSEVYELREGGSEMWEWGVCNVRHIPKVLSSRAGKFYLYVPQVGIAWVATGFWTLDIKLGTIHLLFSA
jgi:hypothetical protein